MARRDNNAPPAQADAEFVGANHGWTSRWEDVTPEEAAVYLHRCQSHQDPYRPHDNLVALVRSDAG